jgi:pyridoxal phosphate enzyme (YggS family)
MPSSLVSKDQIASNLVAIQSRIVAAAEGSGRAADSVTLIAVTKSVGVREVEILYELGVRHFGENRPEDCGGKVAALPADAVWHEIGNLQRRKAKTAVALFQRIDELQLQRGVLIEVNVSGEAAKHGVSPGEVGEMLASIRTLPSLTVHGLMTMAPFDAPESVLRPVFSGLRQLAEQHALPVVSMGMTDDFELAIAEGATEVRIGRALFV